ncbi:MAG: hypothetical protein IPJ34_34825 [Myxococcales bacterium]|nr:hypothetical protein [Myxococcales bacterium]
MTRVSVLLVSALSLVGCGISSGDGFAELASPSTTPLVARRGTVIADGCSLDPWQAQTLAADATAKVVQEVVFLCALPLEDGRVGPLDAGARKALVEQVAALHPRYKVRIGASFTDGTGYRFDPAQLDKQLGDPLFRDAAAKSLLDLARLADGVELDLQKVPSTAKANLTVFVAGLRSVLGPTHLGMLLPPPGSDAGFDLPALGKSVDRLRIMTLDYSDPEAGPVADPGWTMDSYRFVRGFAGPTVALDIAYPLYGIDTGPKGGRLVSFVEAQGLAALYGQTPARGPTGALHFGWTDAQGGAHTTWYDDANSTLWALHALDDAKLPDDVGVVYYALGTEDPALFSTLARARP